MAKYENIGQMELAAAEEEDNTVSMRLRSENLTGHTWLRVVALDDGSVVRYLDTKAHTTVISREDADRYIDYETKKFYFIKIYKDEEPRKFSHAVFNKVQALDKDDARRWGVEIAEKLGIKNPSIAVEFDFSRPSGYKVKPDE